MDEQPQVPPLLPSARRDPAKERASIIKELCFGSREAASGTFEWLLGTLVVEEALSHTDFSASDEPSNLLMKLLDIENDGKEVDPFVTYLTDKKQVRWFPMAEFWRGAPSGKDIAHAVGAMHLVLPDKKGLLRIVSNSGLGLSAKVPLEWQRFAEDTEARFTLAELKYLTDPVNSTRPGKDVVHAIDNYKHRKNYLFISPQTQKQKADMYHTVHAVHSSDESLPSLPVAKSARYMYTYGTIAVNSVADIPRSSQWLYLNNKMEEIVSEDIETNRITFLLANACWNPWLGKAMLPSSKPLQRGKYEPWKEEVFLENLPAMSDSDLQAAAVHDVPGVSNASFCVLPPHKGHPVRHVLANKQVGGTCMIQSWVHCVRYAYFVAQPTIQPETWKTWYVKRLVALIPKAMMIMAESWAKKSATTKTAFRQEVKKPLKERFLIDESDLPLVWPQTLLLDFDRAAAWIAILKKMRHVLWPTYKRDLPAGWEQELTMAEEMVLSIILKEHGELIFPKLSTVPLFSSNVLKLSATTESPAQITVSRRWAMDDDVWVEAKAFLTKATESKKNAYTPTLDEWCNAMTTLTAFVRESFDKSIPEEGDFLFKWNVHIVWLNAMLEHVIQGLYYLLLGRALSVEEEAKIVQSLDALERQMYNAFDFEKLMNSFPQNEDETAEFRRVQREPSFTGAWLKHIEYGPRIFALMRCMTTVHLFDYWCRKNGQPTFDMRVKMNEVPENNISPINLPIVYSHHHSCSPTILARAMNAEKNGSGLHFNLNSDFSKTDQQNGWLGAELRGEGRDDPNPDDVVLWSIRRKRTDESEDNYRLSQHIPTISFVYDQKVEYSLQRRVVIPDPARVLSHIFRRTVAMSNSTTEPMTGCFRQLKWSGPVAAGTQSRSHSFCWFGTKFVSFRTTKRYTLAQPNSFNGRLSRLSWLIDDAPQILHANADTEALLFQAAMEDSGTFGMSPLHPVKFEDVPDVRIATRVYEPMTRLELAAKQNMSHADFTSEQFIGLQNAKLDYLRKVHALVLAQSPAEKMTINQAMLVGILLIRASRTKGNMNLDELKGLLATWSNATKRLYQPRWKEVELVKDMSITTKSLLFLGATHALAHLCVDQDVKTEDHLTALNKWLAWYRYARTQACTADDMFWNAIVRFLWTILVELHDPFKRNNCIVPALSLGAIETLYARLYATSPDFIEPECLDHVSQMHGKSFVYYLSKPKWWFIRIKDEKLLEELAQHSNLTSDPESGYYWIKPSDLDLIRVKLPLHMKGMYGFYDKALSKSDSSYIRWFQNIEQPGTRLVTLSAILPDLPTNIKWYETARYIVDKCYMTLPIRIHCNDKFVFVDIWHFHSKSKLELQRMLRITFDIQAYDLPVLKMPTVQFNHPKYVGQSFSLQPLVDIVETRGAPSSQFGLLCSEWCNPLKTAPLVLPVLRGTELHLILVGYGPWQKQIHEARSTIQFATESGIGFENWRYPRFSLFRHPHKTVEKVVDEYGRSSEDNTVPFVRSIKMRYANVEDTKSADTLLLSQTILPDMYDPCVLLPLTTHLGGLFPDMTSRTVGDSQDHIFLGILWAYIHASYANHVRLISRLWPYVEIMIEDTLKADKNGAHARKDAFVSVLAKCKTLTSIPYANLVYKQDAFYQKHKLSFAEMYRTVPEAARDARMTIVRPAPVFNSHPETIMHLSRLFGHLSNNVQSAEWLAWAAFRTWRGLFAQVPLLYRQNWYLNGAGRGDFPLPSEFKEAHVRLPDILFEISTGSLIQREQFTTVNEMEAWLCKQDASEWKADEAKTKQGWPLLRTPFMGSGKTQVMTPLLILRLLMQPVALFQDKPLHVLLVVPPHLVLDSLKRIKNVLLPILPDVACRTMDRATTEDRQAWIKLQEMDVKVPPTSVTKAAASDKKQEVVDLTQDEEKQVPKPRDKKGGIKRCVTVISDVVFKESLLYNRLPEDTAHPSTPWKPLKDVYVIMDEVDLMYNPMSSEFNFVNEKGANLHPVMCDPDFQAACEGENATHWYENMVCAIAFSYYDLITKSKWPSEAEKGVDLILNVAKSISPHIASVMSSSDKKEVTLKWKNFLAKLDSVANSLNTMVINQHCGLVEDMKTKLLTVPFLNGQADVDAKFSDPDVCTMLTCLAYAHLYKTSANSFPRPLDLERFEAYGVYRAEATKLMVVSEETSGLNVWDEKKKPIPIPVQNVSELLLSTSIVEAARTKRWVMMQWYICHLVLRPFMSYTTTQNSVPFSMLMKPPVQTFFTVSMSGTAIKMPWADRQDNGLDKRMNDVLENADRFSTDARLAAAHASAAMDPSRHPDLAIFGLMQHLKRKISLYSILIDVGAVLRDIPFQAQLDLLATTYPGRTNILFFDQKTNRLSHYTHEKKFDTWTATEDTMKVLTRRHQQDKNMRYILYYDFGHIVGTDVPFQPEKDVAALCTVSVASTRLAELAQGTFRLRPLLRSTPETLQANKLTFDYYVVDREPAIAAAAAKSPDALLACVQSVEDRVYRDMETKHAQHERLWADCSRNQFAAGCFLQEAKYAPLVSKTLIGRTQVSLANSVATQAAQAQNVASDMTSGTAKAQEVSQAISVAMSKLGLQELEYDTHVVPFLRRYWVSVVRQYSQNREADIGNDLSRHRMQFNNTLFSLLFPILQFGPRALYLYSTAVNDSKQTTSKWIEGAHMVPPSRQVVTRLVPDWYICTSLGTREEAKELSEWNLFLERNEIVSAHERVLIQQSYPSATFVRMDALVKGEPWNRTLARFLFRLPIDKSFQGPFVIGLREFIKAHTDNLTALQAALSIPERIFSQDQNGGKLLQPDILAYILSPPADQAPKRKTRPK